MNRFLTNNIYGLFIKLNNILDYLGFGLYRKQGKTQIKEFINSLQPIQTQFELIRIGSQNDGGYLVPNDLDGITAVYSPGVDKNSSFELFFAQKGINCYLLDYSIEELPIEHPRFHFKKKFLGNYDNEIYITFESWLNETAESGNSLVLQMDIEGHEWEVLSRVDSSLLEKFRILVIEFHGLPERLSMKSNFENTSYLFRKLEKFFEIAHIHENNCCKSIRTRGTYVPEVVEITFIRKDRMTGLRKPATIPHRLDEKNVKENKKIKVPKEWTHGKQ
jgi:hypothetical protein